MSENVKRMKELAEEAKKLAEGMSEDELSQVAGGGGCACVIGGYGGGADFHVWDTGPADTNCECGCALGGWGNYYNSEGEVDTRCFCTGAGGGVDK
jgi:hypothetical protein